MIEQQFASKANDNQKNFKSITEVSSIQEFIDTIQLEQDYERKKQAQFEQESEMKLIMNDPQESIENKEKRYHSELTKIESFNYENLPIPRKPSWNENTKKQLLTMEEEIFINWRRSLANTAKENLEMTPRKKY